MSLRLYMDHHVPAPITQGLRVRGVDVITAGEDGAQRVPDEQLLDRSTALDRVLFSQDEDFIAEGVRRQRARIPFAGIIYGHQLRVQIGQCIDDLELICAVHEPDEYRDRIEFLPLK